MSVKERLKKFIKYKNLTNSAFCQTIGVSNAFISSMRTSIQPDKIENIALKYPDLNTGWLMTGEGEMLKSQSEEKRVDSPSVESLLRIIEEKDHQIKRLFDLLEKK